MIRLRHARGQSFALFGLGRSGLATALSLREGGAEVVVWDDSDKGREGAEALGLTLGDLTKQNWHRFASLVLSPGVPHNFPRPHPVAELAHEAGIPIIGDGELFARELAAWDSPAPVIAITGTNGKSTTSALLAHLLTRHGVEVALGGNIGRPMLDLPELNGQDNACYVLEISSFQSELAPSFAPSVGVITNISPDHLDRHGSMENYVALKSDLLNRSSSIVSGIDDSYCRHIYEDNKTSKRALAISKQKNRSADIYYDQHSLWGLHDGAAELIVPLHKARDVKGAHNGQNAAAALAAARLIFDKKEAFSGEDFISFQGLPHRLQYIGTLDGVSYYNDSKATNGASTLTALQTFDRVRLILGGLAKEDGLAELMPYLDRIEKAYLIGDCAQKFADELKGKALVSICGDLPRAFREATLDARCDDHSESTVLFSPAAASFDQFRNFEHRGDVFIGLVKGELTA